MKYQQGYQIDRMICHGYLWGEPCKRSCFIKWMYPSSVDDIIGDGYDTGQGCNVTLEERKLNWTIGQDDATSPWNNSCKGFNDDKEGTNKRLSRKMSTKEG